MATIKELVEKETAAFEKAQRIKQSTQKVADNITARSELAKEAKKIP